MNLKLNETAPDFVAETTQGTIRLHEWMQEQWVVLFSHPRAFTRICTSELASLAATQSDYVNRSVKLIGVGPDPVSSQRALADQIQQATGARIDFPIIGDPNLEVLTLYNMLGADSASERGATVRSVFLIGPDQRIRMMLAYPMETARNFHEILRVIDSLRLTALYNTASADEGVAASPIMRQDKASRGLLGFKALFGSLRREILPF
jgi:thioredoxin-dependent peroxiredoxin